ncbi:flagellar biosynthesis anti-sigma factor FlgM [Anaerocolumna sp. AGMB13025]|uniref:flagellar biosynthesis anti-sigma factor FlgM n=1 Tax=Anaerocolumna sp. AGMB13025 TaxID=3039116 RepID=UPI00241D41E6|nr:flagellar biosynthesis anti-sigma factor FlgM [Anaerocolumna sp. AGMB13025]WFR56812.1 flagellar biosynthesis anti-sigma factor FlgM [Anaerocolumna sp. AGMB13025]
MRIDAYNKISQVYQTSAVTKTSKVQGTSAADQLEISRTAKDYQVAKQAVSATQDIRADKVNEIKKRLESGNYNISMEEVADKITESYFEKLI